MHLSQSGVFIPLCTNSAYMKALVQHQEKGKLQWEEVPQPKPKKGEVLVKMAYAQINPSDLSLLQGSYNEKPEHPLIPGLEGSGEVVENGGGLLGKLRLGKKVGVSKKQGHGGTWAEFVVTDATSVIPLGNIPLETGAGFIVNPLTAVAFAQIIRQHKHHVVYMNAAGGDLGQLMALLSESEGFTLIADVRSTDQVAHLKNLSVKHILNSRDSNYQEELTECFQRLKPSLLLDAVGGKHCEQLIALAPAHSTYMPFANLSEEKAVFDPRQLLQKEIRIEGFSLGPYAHQAGMLQLLKNMSKAKKLVQNGFERNIRQIIQPSEVNEALENYQKEMGKGKVLIGF